MTSQPLEQRLVAYYRKQEDCYQSLLAIATSLSGTPWNSQENDSGLQKMQTLMNDIQINDADNVSHRDAWEASNSTAGNDLTSVIQRVKLLILEVARHVEMAEAAARQAKSILAPQLTANSQRRKMKMAYDSQNES